MGIPCLGSAQRMNGHKRIKAFEEYSANPEQRVAELPERSPNDEIENRNMLDLKTCRLSFWFLTTLG